MVFWGAPKGEAYFISPDTCEQDTCNLFWEVCMCVCSVLQIHYLYLSVCEFKFGESSFRTYSFTFYYNIFTHFNHLCETAWDHSINLRFFLLRSIRLWRQTELVERRVPSMALLKEP